MTKTICTEDGIVIESSGVTVDLMGFSLTGDGGNVDYGIYVDGSTNAMNKQGGDQGRHDQWVLGWIKLQVYEQEPD